MRVTDRQMAQVIAELLEEKGAPKDGVMKSLYRFLERKHWLHRLDKIFESLERYLNEKEGRLPVTVTSARALSPSLKKGVMKEAEALFPQHRLSLEYREDPHLIGGVRLETEDVLYDSTLRTALNKLSHSL